MSARLAETGGETVIYKNGKPVANTLVESGNTINCRECKHCDSCNVANAFQYRIGKCVMFDEKPLACRCGGPLSEIRYHNGKPYRHCFACHFEFYLEGGEE